MKKFHFSLSSNCALLFSMHKADCLEQRFATGRSPLRENMGIARGEFCSWGFCLLHCNENRECIIELVVVAISLVSSFFGGVALSSACAIDTYSRPALRDSFSATTGQGCQIQILIFGQFLAKKRPNLAECLKKMANLKSSDSMKYWLPKVCFSFSAGTAFFVF